MKYLTKWTDGSKIYSSTLSGTPLATSTKYDRCEISLNSDGLIVPSTNSIYWGGQKITALEIYSVDDVQLEKISFEFPPKKLSLVTKTGRVELYTTFKTAGVSPYTYAENYPQYEIYTGDELTDTQNFDTRIPMPITVLNGLVFDIDGDIAMNVKAIGGRAHHYLLSASDPDVAPQKAICWTSSATGKLDSGTYGNQILEYLGEGYAVTSIPNIYNLEVGEEEDPPTGPYAPGGPSSPGGGGGSFGKDEVSDEISPDVPSGSVMGQDSSTGMYTRYLMNSSYLENLGDWVFDPGLGLSLIVTALSAIYGNPAESMISLMAFPFSLSAPFTGVTTRTQDLYFGHQSTGANYVALTSGSCTIDWGTITLEEYWGNFLDYAPHTKIELYLPWGTGFVPIDPGHCLPGTLKVVTNVEFAKGSCVHNIINSQGVVIGTYMGQPGTLVPLISSDIAAKRAGAVIAGASLIVGGAVALGASGVAQAAGSHAFANSMAHGSLLGKSGRPLYGAAKMARAGRLHREANEAAELAYGSTMSALESATGFAKKLASDVAVASARHPVEIARNGGFGDASAGMMVQYPYIILSRPEQNVPENYGHHYGYPSNVYQQLAFLSGYTEIASIHLDGIGATDAEIDELESILSGGVIF